MVRPGFRLSSGDPGPETPPPVLGQDTDQILSELGYAPAEIERLRALNERLVGALAPFAAMKTTALYDLGGVTGIGGVDLVRAKEAYAAARQEPSHD